LSNDTSEIQLKIAFWRVLHVPGPLPRRSGVRPQAAEIRVKEKRPDQLLCTMWDVLGDLLSYRSVLLGLRGWAHRCHRTFHSVRVVISIFIAIKNPFCLSAYYSYAASILIASS